MSTPRFKSTLSSEYLRRLKARESGVLDELFRTINPRLFALLAANGILAESAEDLVHQTWERFFTNLEQFEGRSELSTFICGILVNKMREHRRAQRRLILEEDNESIMQNAFTPEGWWKVEPRDPAALMESAEVAKFIEECLAGLNESQSTAFVLKEVEGERSEEICNVLQVSVSNLRVLIFRAKEKLRLCLEGKLGVKE
jgi:RNA polymerase sigma factor (sigma-70 family)